VRPAGLPPHPVTRPGILRLKVDERLSAPWAAAGRGFRVRGKEGMPMSPVLKCSVYAGLIAGTEPPRDSRRLHFLRGLEHGKTESIFT
jgi:hypothetical protein